MGYSAAQRALARVLAGDDIGGYLSGSLAMLFRLRWPLRFTLRSLFIAMTFLAVVLGMIAWLDRAWIGK
jgi:hypothetical protein